jgi:hypothetical protein
LAAAGGGQAGLPDLSNVGGFHVRVPVANRILPATNAISFEQQFRFCPG